MKRNYDECVTKYSDSFVRVALQRLAYMFRFDARNGDLKEA